MDIYLTFGRPDPAASTRHVSTLVIAFVVAFFAQSVFLPCLCGIGAAKMQMAFIVDVIIFLRVLFAFFTQEKTAATLYFYSVLLLTSPFWIEFIFRAYGLQH